MISDSTIEEILQVTCIEEVIADFVSLKKRGSNYIGLCPFHDEKTPSFNVNPARGIFKCFGCGKGGDTIEFLREYKKFTYTEALQFLARKYYIGLDELLIDSIKGKKSKKKYSDVLLTQKKFLKKYYISEEEFEKTKLKWENLKIIYDEYNELKNKLEQQATALASVFLSKDAKDQGVHSIRYRIKDAHSLIEKIIRKKIKDPKRNINPFNYREEITDLIGIRVLHTFKNDWYWIHHFISSMFLLKNNTVPIVFYRDGDEKEFLDMCENCGCKKEKHDKGYRSVHYIILTQLTKEKYYAEIQVRTIFEEGWSEIDHKIRYSFKGHINSSLDDELRNLNRAAGHADEISSTIRKREQEEQKRIFKRRKG